MLVKSPGEPGCKLWTTLRRDVRPRVVHSLHAARPQSPVSKPCCAPLIHRVVRRGEPRVAGADAGYPHARRRRCERYRAKPCPRSGQSKILRSKGGWATRAAVAQRCRVFGVGPRFIFTGPASPHWHGGVEGARLSPAVGVICAVQHSCAFPGAAASVPRHWIGGDGRGLAANAAMAAALFCVDPQQTSSLHWTRKQGVVQPFHRPPARGTPSGARAAEPCCRPDGARGVIR